MQGELMIDATGKIACAAASCSATTGYAQATAISCPSGVLSPGLVNAHDHTEYATGAPVTNQTRYQHRNEWRTGADGAMPLPKVNSTTDVHLIAAEELRQVMGGTTSVVGSGGVSGLERNLAAFKNPEQLEGATGQTTFFDTFPLGDSNGTILTSGCAYPKPRAPSSAFSGGQYAPHIAEGINLGAENEFECLSDPTFNNVLVTSKTSIIHAVGLNAKDVDRIAKAQAKVIWSPRSNISLYGNTADVTELKNAGVTIALGTDWLASGSINELRELQCADALNQKYFAKTFSDRELFEMATINAAIAAGFDTQIGALKVGMLGDVVLYDGSKSADYRAVIDAGVEDVHLVLRGGKVLFGDADLVAALSSACAALDVCGVKKNVCVDTPMVDLPSIQRDDADERAVVHAVSRHLSERHLRDRSRWRWRRRRERRLPRRLQPAALDGQRHAVGRRRRRLRRCVRREATRQDGALIRRSTPPFARCPRRSRGVDRDRRARC
jgi:imidazolonepropionase-like amidohydrolase